MMFKFAYNPYKNQSHWKQSHNLNTSKVTFSYISVALGAHQLSL